MKDFNDPARGRRSASGTPPSKNGRFSTKKDRENRKGEHRHEKGLQRYLRALKIGDVIFGNYRAVINGFTGSHSLRYAVVWGIYTKGKKVVALDLMGLSSQKKPLSIPKSLIQDGDPDGTSYLRPLDVITAVNLDAFFSSKKHPNGVSVPPPQYTNNLFSEDPNTLARTLALRSNAFVFSQKGMQANNIHQDIKTIINDPEVTRTGFTYGLPAQSIRAEDVREAYHQAAKGAINADPQTWVPDLEMGICQREFPKEFGISADEMRLISEFAYFYSKEKSNGKLGYRFPPINRWGDLGFSGTALPNWPEFEQTQKTAAFAPDTRSL